MRAAPRPLVLVGQIDTISPEGDVIGWCWSPQEPATRREVALVVDGRVLATALAGLRRDELVSVGIGDGAHGFSATLQRDRLPPAAGAVGVQLQDASSGHPVGAPVRYTYPAAETSTRPISMRVFVDEVGEEGLVRGWCWSPSEPGHRVRLNVLVDGAVVGSTVADMHRGDLEAAGIGDGSHAFAFLLPWESIAAKAVVQVAVAEARTGMLLPASSIFRRPVLRPIEERLHDMERQVRLLGSHLAEVERRAGHDRAMLRGVLATIGNFFTRLSETEPEDVPAALVPSLPDLATEVAERLGVIELARPERPVMTVWFRAIGTLEELHACLAACHATGLDQHADIGVLDGGEMAEAALLPSVARNLRYWRLQPGQRLGEALLVAATRPMREFTALFSPAVRVGNDWLSNALAIFAQYPTCGMLAPKLVRDGAIAGFGLLPRAGRLIDPALAESIDEPEFAHVQPVAAPSAGAMVVRTALLAALDGFDTAFADLPSALADLGLRCWAAGRPILSQGPVALAWHDTASPEPVLGTVAATLLSERWFAAIPEKWPRPLGQALVIGGDDTAAELECATALQALGWQVTFAAPTLDGDASAAEAFRNVGVRVLSKPFQDSLSGVIAAADGGYALIRLGSGALQALPADRVRTLSPGSKLLLAVEGHAQAEVVAAATIVDAVQGLPGDEALGRAGLEGKLLSGPVEPLSWEERQGVWLAMESGEAGVTEMAWFASSVLPGLRKALGGVKLYCQPGSGLTRRAGITDVTDQSARARVRFVLSVGQMTGLVRADLPPASEGTPILWLRAQPATAENTDQQTMTLLPAQPAAAIKEVVRHYIDPAAWQAIRPPSPSGEAARLAQWAAALARLGLPFRSQ